MIDWVRADARARELLERVGLRERPGTAVKHLGVGKQQLVEIAKALGKEVRLLILDEPTAALNEGDSEHLLGLLRGLRDQGVTCILISHKLGEVLGIADAVTLLRDGRSVETLRLTGEGKEAVDEDRLIRGMVGRSLGARFPEGTAVLGEPFFEVRDWTVRHPSGPGPAGVQGGVPSSCGGGRSWASRGWWGRGRTELALSLFGRSYGVLGGGGRSSWRGRELRLCTVRDAIRHRIAYVSEDPESPGAEPAGLHPHHSGGPPGWGGSAVARSDRPAPGVRRGRRGYRRSLRIKAPSVDVRVVPALRGEPAEGGAGQMAVHRAGPADPRRAHPGDRRGGQVRDLRPDPATGGAGERGDPHLLGASGAAGAGGSGSTLCAREPSRGVLDRDERRTRRGSLRLMTAGGGAPSPARERIVQEEVGR